MIIRRNLGRKGSQLHSGKGRQWPRKLIIGHAAGEWAGTG
jgi:hypothetical protein